MRISNSQHLNEIILHSINFEEKYEILSFTSSTIFIGPENLFIEI